MRMEGLNSSRLLQEPTMILSLHERRAKSPRQRTKAANKVIGRYVIT